jgi:hypothetical protein
MKSRHSPVLLLLYMTLILLAGCAGGPDFPYPTPGETNDPGNTPGPADNTSNMPDNGNQSTPPTSTGVGSCADILSCVYQCPETDYETCEQGCISQGDANAQQLFGALIACEEAAWTGSCQSICQGTDDNACYDCLGTACSTQYIACEGDQTSGDNTTDPPPTGGAGSCVNIMDCAYQCPDANFYACEQACMSQADGNAQQLYGAIIACEEAALNGTCLNACQGWDIDACYACMDNACMAQYLACEADV